jgi:hypothetical protein
LEQGYSNRVDGKPKAKYVHFLSGHRSFFSFFVEKQKNDAINNKNPFQVYSVTLLTIKQVPSILSNPFDY